MAAYLQATPSQMRRPTKEHGLRKKCQMFCTLELFKVVDARDVSGHILNSREPTVDELETSTGGGYRCTLYRYALAGLQFFENMSEFLVFVCSLCALTVNVGFGSAVEDSSNPD